MKASKKVFTAMALAVVCCIWGHPASAGNPDQQLVYYNCVDAYDDPLLTCFGDDSCIDEYGDVVNCADISGSQTCQQYLVMCESACSSQESADMNACARGLDQKE
jgi:hypothetical protein